MFVYVIVCSETLKIYIGQHKGKDLQHYLQQKQYEARKRLKARSHLYAAMRKHPSESWSIHALAGDVASRSELDSTERHFIRSLNSQHAEVGYNICSGGQGFSGPHSASARRKLSVAHMGHATSEETRQKIAKAVSLAQKGKKKSLSPARRDQLSSQMTAQMQGNTYWKNVKRHPLSAGHRKKISDSKLKSCIDWWVGRKHSSETKAKISEARRRAAPVSEESRKKMSATRLGRPSPMLGRKHTEETKVKIREAGRASYFIRTVAWG